MNPDKYCATCHPETMPEHVRAHSTQETKRSWLSFDRFMPILLGILVIISTIQTMEMMELKASLAAQEQAITGTSPVTSQATPVASTPYQALPAQVGGC